MEFVRACVCLRVRVREIQSERVRERERESVFNFLQSQAPLYVERQTGAGCADLHKDMAFLDIHINTPLSMCMCV